MEANPTKPRKCSAGYSQRVRSLRCRPSQAKNLSTSHRLPWRRSFLPSCEFCIENIAVVCLVSNQFLRSHFNHIEVERQLYKSYFMMVCSMRGHRNRQPATIDNSHYFHALATPRLADLTTTALSCSQHCIDETFSLVYASLLAKRISQISQNSAEHATSAPPLKSTMNRLIVRIT
jgi:hypothetical protein